MRRQDWQRVGWVATGLMMANLSILTMLWIAPMPPETLPNPPPITPTTTPPSAGLSEPPVESASSMAALDAVLAGRLEQVAMSRGIPPESVLPDDEIRRVARETVDPHSIEAQALLAAYAEAFEALDHR
ncbi:MAG: hypothetical protein ACI8RZ_005081 [Myxococcota bacterium]|jgi:hypothetical protein